MTQVILDTRPFKTEQFQEAFDDLFVNANGRKGPLTHILDDYAISPGKGGSRFANNSDMSYFVHVLNAALIGGKAFERELLNNNRDLELLKGKIRLFFSAMVLHDINKLFEPEDYKSSLRLDIVFEKNIQEIMKITGSYLASIGPESNWLPDLKYLILITENTTADLANKIETFSDRTELEVIGRFLKLGDTVCGGIKNTDSLDIFQSIKTSLLNFYRDGMKDLHFIKLPDIPQTMVRIKFIDILTKVLTENEREIVVRMPDSVVFLGKEIDSDILSNLTSNLNKIFPLDTHEQINEYIKQSKPTNNSIKLSCFDRLDPSHDNIDRYIEVHNSKIFLWSGRDWRKEHKDFPSIAQKWGIEISSTGSTDVPRFEVKWYDKSEDDTDVTLKRDRVKLACAKRILLELDKEYEDPSDLVEINEGADLIQKKTNLSIAFVKEWKDNPKEKYSELLTDLSERLRENYHANQTPDTDTSRYINYLLGRDLIDDDLKVPKKEDVCVQCGRFSTIPFKDENSFGFKPTGGGKHKLSKLSYNEKYNGKICDLCKLENELRKKEFSNINTKSKDAISIQIFLGDFISPFNVKNAFGVIADSSKELVGVSDDKVVLRLSDRSSIQLNYYAIGFVDRPSNIIEQFQLLQRSINFVSASGLKIHISPLFNFQRIVKPIFTWVNSPGWVKELHWDNLRIDQIKDVQWHLNFLYSIASMNRRNKDIPICLHGFVRGPRGLLQIIWNLSNQAQKKRNFSALKKVENDLRIFLEKNGGKMNLEKMDKMVNYACEMVNDRPTTNNDRTWMIREAFDVYERWILKQNPDIKDIQSKIAAQLYKIATGDKYNNREKAEQASIGFAETFIEIMQLEFPKKVPRSEEKRDIVAQFALMYNMKKWGDIKERSNRGGDMQ